MNALEAARRALWGKSRTVIIDHPGTLAPSKPVDLDNAMRETINMADTVEPTLTNSERYMAMMTETVAKLDTERASLEETLRLETKQFEARKAELEAAIADNAKTAQAADAFIRSLTPPPKYMPPSQFDVMPGASFEPPDDQEFAIEAIKADAASIE